MSRVLVVEDERDIREVMEIQLSKAGFAVSTADTGDAGLASARQLHPDLILLDLMLPGLSGTEVLKELRADRGTRDVPVVILSARGQEVDRVLAFELGADDYVVKPVSGRELALRVRAILHRSSTARQSESVERFGRLTIDESAHRVFVDGQEVALTALEFKLLLTLHDRRDRVQTRDRLLDDVWGIQADVTTRTVDTHVKRLRQKLGPAGEYVETVRGYGYRFRARP